MGLLEPQHIILIVFALLLLFGGKKIPELMKGLGTGIKEFKNAQHDPAASPSEPKEKAIDQPKNA